MHSLPVRTVLVSLFLQTVAAQDAVFQAPQLEDANLAVYAFLALATLVQLLLAAPFLLRTRAHFLPGIAIVVTLVSLLVAYALSVARTVDEFTVTDFDDQSIISPLAYVKLQVATYFVDDWADAMMCLAILLVLRDRYLTHTRNSTRPLTRIPLLPLTIPIYVLVVFMFAFASASDGLYGSTQISSYLDEIDLDVTESRLKIVNDLFYTNLAFYILTTLFLVILAILVKKAVKSDTIASIVVFAVAPLSLARAIASLVFTIVENRLPNTDANSFALDLSTTAVYGGLYLIILYLLVFCLMSLRLWDIPNGPVHGHNPAQQVLYLGGMQPVAAFSGQWGFTGGQPQSTLQGYPAPHAPHQVNPGSASGPTGQPPQAVVNGAIPPSTGEMKIEEIQVQSDPLPSQLS